MFVEYQDFIRECRYVEIVIIVDDKINNNEIVLVKLDRIEKEMGYGQVCEIIKV